MWLIQHYINRRLVAVSATDSVVLLNMRKIYFLNTLMLCVLLWPSLVLTGALFPTWTLQFADVCTALRTSSPPGVVLQKQNTNKTAHANVLFSPNKPTYCKTQAPGPTLYWPGPGTCMSDLLTNRGLRLADEPNAPFFVLSRKAFFKLSWASP